ncbi:putative diguanylate cyclase YeaJ [bacterium BMS3Abin14]|nr:putative diguanylate cyclase YeaJ [bacterium BMS3Abin14]
MKITPGGVLATDGRRFTQILFPEMIRLLSAVPDKTRKIRFHLTSLKPLNPKNAPDPWERSALLRVEKGEPRVYGFSKAPGNRELFRYLRPIYAEKMCLDCHAIQGYHLGDVRGGASVTLDVTDLIWAFSVNTKKEIAIGIFLWIVGLALIFLVFTSVERRKKYLVDLKAMSLEDYLTGLSNRRGFLVLAQQATRLIDRVNFKALILLYFDLDDFKQINDVYGHKEGDAALTLFSQVLRSTFRQSDLLARMGGDEFLVFALDTGESCEKMITDRLQRNLEEANAESGKPYFLKVSFGAVEYDPDRSAFFEELIIEADRRMYENKAAKKASGGGADDDGQH